MVPKHLFTESRPSDPEAHLWSDLSISILALMAGLLPVAILLTLGLMGPTSLVGLRASWVAVLLALLTSMGLWWVGYLWLLNRLSGRGWRQGLRRSTWILGLMALSCLPDLAVFLSGRLPYVMGFDSATGLLYGRLAVAILCITVAGQELMLLLAIRGEGPVQLAGAFLQQLVRLPGLLAQLPGLTVRQIRLHRLLVGLLLAAMILRMIRIDEAHPGDMNVLLSAVFSILTWPPTDYYHNYRPQPWVYNHLPLFPLMLAPFYWLFENVLRLPTAWAAKLLIDVADLVVAILLYSQARGKWQRTWALGVAAAWLFAPWVMGGDDHPIAPAIALAMGALLTLERGWLSGMLLGLALATRSEVAFLGLPVVVYFASRRGLSQTVAFLAVLGTTLAVVAIPFALYDPQAMDYALRQQIQRDASNELSALSTVLLPYLDPVVARFLQQNPSLLALGVNLLIAPLAVRDSRILRVVTIAALGYLLTLPVLHTRYMLFAYAVGLLYAVRNRNPILALALVAMGALVDYGITAYVLVAVFGSLALGSLGPWVAVFRARFPIPRFLRG